MTNFESALEFIMSLKETLRNLTVRGGSVDFCRKIILSTNNTIALKHLTCELQNNSVGEQYYLEQPCIESLHLTNSQYTVSLILKFVRISSNVFYLLSGYVENTGEKTSIAQRTRI